MVRTCRCIDAGDIRYICTASQGLPEAILKPNPLLTIWKATKFGAIGDFTSEHFSALCVQACPAG